MISEEATPAAIEISRSFVGLIRSLETPWNVAYLRCLIDSDFVEAKASYAYSGQAEIIDVLKNKEFFHAIADKTRVFFDALHKSDGLFLLTVTSSLDYEFQFEYADMQRWWISKLNSGTGFPAGVD